MILLNEQRFIGTVLAGQTDPDYVEINTGTGILRLRREIVAKVELGLTARIGRVKSSDLEGLTALARECRSRKRNRESLELLKKAISLPACDLPTRGLYAQLVDEIEGPEPALPLYLAYRSAGGDDKEILERLSELETARQKWETDMRNQGLDPLASAASGQPVAAATATAIEEGFEKFGWTGDDKWANPVKTTLMPLTTTEGVRRVMQVEYSPNESNAGFDKASVVLRRQLSLKAGAKLGFNICNLSGKDLAIAIALKTSDKWVYFESPPQRIPASGQAQEFTAISYDLSAANFKSQASNWAYSSSIADPDKVRELQILIMNGRSSGKIWLAGIGLDAPEY